jgi:capsular exopolysaccharide synthesis family protein
VDFKDLLRMARRRWLTIVALFLACVAAMGALTFSQTPQYQSTSRIFISTDTTNSAEAFYASGFTTQRVKSYAELATSRELMQKVISRLNLNMTPADLASKITATVDSETVIILLSVLDPDPAVAQQIARAESEELSEYLTVLETPLSKATSPIKATVVDPASYNASPVSPRPMINLVIGGMIGLLLGLAAAVTRDILDNTVSSAEDVANVIEAPVLASIAYDSDVPKRPLLTEASSRAPRVEAFRLLRTNLQFLNLDTRPTSLVITSAIPGEGKTSTATNLAIALAQTGQRVVLVDGDLRRPKVASVLGLERSVGITTVLVGRSELHESVQKHSASGIYFLASGPIPPNPTEVLQSQAAQALFDRLNEMFDMVIIDAPPLLPVSDAAIMARDVDGAILVVRHGKTTKDQLRQARQRLAQVDANLFGVAVNMTPRRDRGAYGYGYDYGYEIEYEPKRAKVQ